MNSITQRIAKLRSELQSRNLHAFIITGSDPHSSEYTPQHWEIRKYITGFTGSYGVVVITIERAGLWTDSRYFIQAEQELQNWGIEIHKHRAPGAVEPEQWLTRNLPPRSRVGIDSHSVSLNMYRKLASTLNEADIEIVETTDLFSKVWIERPPLPSEPVFALPEKITGASRTHKLKLIDRKLEENRASGIIINTLDELAWIFNLRGNDIPYNPLFLGYAIITKKSKILFTNLQRVSKSLQESLKDDGIILKEYHEFFSFLQSLKGESFLIDPHSTNLAIQSCLKHHNKIIEVSSPVALLKRVKNPVEQRGFRKAMISDGVVLVEFLYWLYNNVKKGGITEYIAAEKLIQLRSQLPEYRGESFSPIIGYRDHGAIVHFNATIDNTHELLPKGLLLFDTGGHYLFGTTDITRTVALGPVTSEQKCDFTLILKGVIALTSAKFPEGTNGCNIDILARRALWEKGLDYGHGTGHGVGHFLPVHEGPTSIRQECSEAGLIPGVVISCEPGVYREGRYGIRVENLLLCIAKESTPFGNFIGFETLSLCPIDLNLIEHSLLTRDEKSWINRYHKDVNSKLKPYLRSETADFLEKITKEI